MITELSKEKVTEIGSRNRAGYLVEQAGYTLNLAKEDGDSLEELLPDGYLNEVAKAAAQLSDALKDRALSEDESKSAAEEVNKLIRQAKVWRRTVVNRCLRASRMGKRIPEDLLKMGKAVSVPAVINLLDETVKLLKANVSNLHGANLERLITEGAALSDGIKTIDAEQETRRLKNLPDAIKEFYYKKGLLFIGIKVVNEAGRELHADNATDAAKYNLSIVYRNVSKKKEQTPSA